MTHSQIYYQRFKTAEQRFWEKVNKEGPTPTHCPELGKCWVWTGSRDKEWHGCFRFNGGDSKGTVKAHRYSFQINVGEIPKRKWILHRCDNPACVRPAHLFIGTYRDNIDDMVKKKRQIFGEQKKMAKLTDEKVREMRLLYRSGAGSVRALAKIFGVEHGNAGKIIRGKAWKHVA